MHSEEKDAICRIIHNYIFDELQEWFNDDIFLKSSLIELGKLYYLRITNTVENANIELVNEVIRSIAKDTVFDTQDDYYVSLCEILFYERVPRDTLVEVTQKQKIRYLIHRMITMYLYVKFYFTKGFRETLW